MRRPRLSKMNLALTAAATVLVVTPSVEAGGGWGWKKPMNQRLGAFYTSNRAFKKNTSSRYRSSSSRYTTQTRTYQASPSYHPHVSSHQGTVVVPSTSSTVIRTIPTPAPRVTTIPSKPNVTAAPPSAPIVTAPIVTAPTRATNPTVKRVIARPSSTTPTLQANPVVSRPIVEKTKAAAKPNPVAADQALKSALDLLTPEPKTIPVDEVHTLPKGAVRLPNPPADSNASGKTSSLPFNSTADGFWE